MSSSDQRNGCSHRMGNTLGPQPLRQALAEDRHVEVDIVVMHLGGHAALEPSLGGGSSPSSLRTFCIARLNALRTAGGSRPNMAPTVCAGDGSPPACCCRYSTTMRRSRSLVHSRSTSS